MTPYCAAQAKVVSSTALQPAAAAGAAAAEAEDRRCVMYEVQWQAAAPAAAAAIAMPLLRHTCAVLTTRDRSGRLVSQVSHEGTCNTEHGSVHTLAKGTGRAVTPASNFNLMADRCPKRPYGVRNVMTRSLAAFVQDVLSSSGSVGASARLAAAQAATLQRRMAANPASLQLQSRGDAVLSQTTPSPIATAGKHRSGGRALAAMLRVAAAEAPATAFSFLEESAALPAARSQAADVSSRPSADAHGQSLSAGAWLAPRLTARHRAAAATSAADSAAFGGRILVTGAH